MNKLSGLGLLGLLAIVAGAFFVLNYFNVISLSLLYPKYFGSLPHATTDLKLPERRTLACPVDADMCKKGTAVINTKSIPTFYGVGYTDFPPKNNYFKAIMPGIVSIGATVDKNKNKEDLISIKNVSWGVEADYSFKGGPYNGIVKKGSVKQGETIGFLSGDKLQQGLLDKQYTLIISLIDLTTGKTIKIDPFWNQELK